MSLSTDLFVRVGVEDLESLGDLVLQVIRATVAHVMKYLVADFVIWILRQLENALPEVLVVPLDSTGAHLLRRFQPHQGVWTPRQLNQLIHIGCILNLPEQVDLLISGEDTLFGAFLAFEGLFFL